MTPDELGYRAFDADNHYYEALDAFTRHVPENMQPRIVQWVDIGGRKHHLVGGKLSRAVANPTWDPIAKPGALRPYFAGNPDRLNPLEMLRDREPLPAHYMDPESRVSVMDEQGLEAVWMFPTLGVLYEELIKDDTDAVVTLMQAFNRWILDDWTYNYGDRIYAAPYISMASVDAARAEVDKVLGLGAQVLVMRPAPAATRLGLRSPFGESFDPVWARINEAGVTVVIHAGDSGYSSQGYVSDRFTSVGMGGGRPSLKAFVIERAAQDFLMQAIFENLFVRFPNLRLASVENGSDFLGPIFRKFDQMSKKYFWAFEDHPVDIFKKHVWMNPFWEDDVNEVVELMGADRVIFGSDWPHIEGMPSPLDYVPELAEFDDDKKRMIMRDNARSLNTPQPV